MQGLMLSHKRSSLRASQYIELLFDYNSLGIADARKHHYYHIIIHYTPYCVLLTYIPVFSVSGFFVWQIPDHALKSLKQSRSSDRQHAIKSESLSSSLYYITIYREYATAFEIGKRQAKTFSQSTQLIYFQLTHTVCTIIRIFLSLGFNIMSNRS